MSSTLLMGCVRNWYSRGTCTQCGLPTEMKSDNISCFRWTMYFEKDILLLNTNFVPGAISCYTTETPKFWAVTNFMKMRAKTSHNQNRTWKSYVPQLCVSVYKVRNTHTQRPFGGGESVERFQRWLLGFLGWKSEDYWIMGHTIG